MDQRLQDTQQGVFVSSQHLQAISARVRTALCTVKVKISGKQEAVPPLGLSHSHAL